MKNEHINELIDVWQRQKKNWKVIATRQVVNRFFGEMARSYSNIYITFLGASPVDLGIVNSFTGISNALISVPLGWAQDKYSIRKIFIMGIGLLAIVPLIYATASSWQIIIPAMVLVALAQKKEGSIITVVLGSQDRFGETEKLIDWAYANFSWQSVIEPTLEPGH